MTEISNYFGGKNYNTLCIKMKDAKNKLLQDFKDREFYARTIARDQNQFNNTLALSSFAFDKNIKTSKEVAQGRLVGGVLASAADSIFNSVFAPDPKPS